MRAEHVAIPVVQLQHLLPELQNCIFTSQPDEVIDGIIGVPVGVTNQHVVSVGVRAGHEALLETLLHSHPACEPLQRR